MKSIWLVTAALGCIVFPPLAREALAQEACADGQLLAQLGGTQSDTTGTVPGPPPGVSGGSPAPVPPPISPELSNLQNDLSLTVAEFQRIEELRENVTRRFGRVASAGECVNPAAARLTQLQQEAEALLERLEAERSDYDAQLEALPEQNQQRSW